MQLFKFNIEAEVDLDDIQDAFKTDRDIKAVLNRVLGMESASLIYYIVDNGINDIKASIPSIDDSLSDIFAKPNPDYGVSLPILDGDDPFATPIEEESVTIPIEEDDEENA